MIKRYLEFIKESKQLSLFPMEEVMRPVVEEKTYRLDDDKIEEIFIEMKDSGYTIQVERGFVEKQYRYGGYRDVFGQKLVKGKIRPAYWINIYAKNPSNDDFTDVVLTAIDYFEENGYKVSLDGDRGVINVDELLIAGGFFLKGIKNDNIGIFVSDEKEIEFDVKELCEYYEWLSDKDKDTFIEGDDIYITIDMEDLSDLLLGDDDYKKQLLDGMMDDRYYDSYEYYPDIISLFTYYLNSVNKVLTIKALIKEYGGLKEFLKKADNDELEGLTEDEVIQYLINERFFRTLDNLCKGSDLIDDIKQTYADYAANNLQNEHYEELVNEFDNIVGDKLTYTKYDKEVEVKKTFTTPDGKSETRTYPEVQTFYKIKYDNEWIEDFDYDFLVDESLYDIFREYCSRNLGNFELKPHFSDYPNVDWKKFNKSVDLILK